MTHFYTQQQAQNVITSVLPILKVASKYRGICRGKFAYEVLSCFNTLDYSRVPSSNTVMKISFKGYEQLRKFLIDATESGIIVRNYFNGKYSTGLDIENIITLDFGDSSGMFTETEEIFINYKCGFDLRLMKVISGLCDNDQLDNVFKKNVYHLTKTGYQMFKNGKLPSEYSSYQIAYKSKLLTSDQITTASKTDSVLITDCDNEPTVQVPLQEQTASKSDSILITHCDNEPTVQIPSESYQPFSVNEFMIKHDIQAPAISDSLFRYKSFDNLVKLLFQYEEMDAKIRELDGYSLTWVYLRDSVLLEGVTLYKESL